MLYTENKIHTIEASDEMKFSLKIDVDRLIDVGYNNC